LVWVMTATNSLGGLLIAGSLTGKIQKNFWIFKL